MGGTIRRIRPERDSKPEKRAAVRVERARVAPGAGAAATARRLVVGAAHDPAEAEADRMAERALQVARSWRGDDARAVETDGSVARRAPTEAAGRTRLSESFEIDAKAVDAASRAGRPLPEATRRTMESGFGTDFGSVRVHTGRLAADVSRSIGARAFTRGADVYFGDGEYRPGSAGGDHVIAHELAHVVQSGHASERSEVHRFPATALTAPVRWSAHKPRVFHPGEGVSGGVYILTSTAGDDSVKKVVVKPVFGQSGIGTRETGEQLVFGDRALKSLLGVNTPKSRVVQNGSPEFKTLVALCLPHYPAPKHDSPEAEDWKPLSTAESFVVMGEVPTATSVGSMADKAAGGGKAAADLHAAVFNDSFLTQLGRLCVGDLLIGNSDRMVARAMNLGNVMVSQDERGASLWAIDTAAVLDKFDPATVMDSGSGSSTLQGGFSSTRGTFKDSPADILEGFYRVIAGRMQRATKPDTPKSGDDRTPAQVFEDTYKANLSKLVAAFEYGWQDALITIYALVNSKQGRKQMKALTGEQKGTAGEEQLQYNALKVNATYLAGKAQEAEHEQAGTDAAALAAYKVLVQLKPEDLALPVDQFFWNVATPDRSMYSADLAHPTALPRASAISRIASMPKFSGYDADGFEAMGRSVAAAKAEADSLGTKKRGLRRKEKVRDRTVAGRFVADSYALGAGAVRAAGLAGRLRSAVDALELVVGSNLKGSQAAKVMPAAQMISGYTKTYEENLKHYEKSLATTAGEVRKLRKYGAAADLSNELAKVGSLLGEADKQVFTPIRKKDPQAMHGALKALAALKR